MSRSMCSQRGVSAGLAMGVLIVLAGPVVLQAQEPPPQPDPTVNRVEEDWVLWVFQPDGQAVCPQFHTVMAPVADFDSFYFMVTWNYWELPSFAPGGFQIQSCYRDQILNTAGVGERELSLFAEVITWTQVMETNGHQIGFTLLNGNSTTWGQFGYPETTIVNDAMVPNLNLYTPEASVAHASITYGRNRVYWLALRQVRYYGSDGLISTDDTFRMVFRIADLH